MRTHQATPDPRRAAVNLAYELDLVSGFARAHLVDTDLISQYLLPFSGRPDPVKDLRAARSNL